MPTSIQQQIKILIATWYANREGTSQSDFKSNSLSYNYLAVLNKNYDEKSCFGINTTYL
jgi:hypothetical protein